MKLYSFANFVEQHLVTYEYASISLFAIEASTYVVIIEEDFIIIMMVIHKLYYVLLKLFISFS